MRLDEVSSSISVVRQSDRSQRQTTFVGNTVGSALVCGLRPPLLSTSAGLAPSPELFLPPTHFFVVLDYLCAARNLLLTLTAPMSLVRASR